MRKFLLTVFCSLSLLSTASALAEAQKVDSSDVVVMLDRLRKLLAPGFPNQDTILSLMHSMQPDGSWKSIDYLNAYVSSWPAIQHLGYVSELASAYSNKASPLFRNKNLAKALHLSLDFWLSHNFTNPNWWWNDIGAPETLSDILVIMDGAFTREELLMALNQMKGSYIRQTGQNRIWRAGIQLKIGLLEYGRGIETASVTSPIDRIRNAMKVLQEQVTVQPEEGIQPDWSFHQHGIQQQFGNYGLSFAASQIQWAWILKDTPFRYSKEKISILRNYILKGLSMVVWRGVMGISACGRQLYPGSPKAKGDQVIDILKRMSEVDPKNTQTYFSYIDCLSGKTTCSSLFAGNIYFWRSDLMIHRTADYFMSIRTHSKIIQGTESGAGYNLKGGYLADGATYIYLTGKEYQDIFPIWNWHRIPGITSYVQEPLPPVGWGGLPNESNFVGGVSDSSFGIAAMLFKRNKLTAYKSWFLSPQGMVCLGAGIHSLKNTDVSTTLNQSNFAGRIMVKTNKRQKTITGTGQSLNGKDIHWVYYDQTGYIILQKDEVHVSADKQAGNWKEIYEQGNPQPITGDVFNLWVDHGNAPVNGHYAYMILPRVSIDSLGYMIRHLPLKIIQNDTSLQAIQYPGKRITQAVFYRAGKINLDKHTILQTNLPCILIAEQINDGLKLDIAAPPVHGEGVILGPNGFPEKRGSQTGSSLEPDEDIILTIDGHYKGEGCHYDPNDNQTKIIFKLPGGIYAGKNILRMLTSL